jgi:hypothetical protein
MGSGNRPFGFAVANEPDFTQHPGSLLISLIILEMFYLSRSRICLIVVAEKILCPWLPEIRISGLGKVA